MKKYLLAVLILSSFFSINSYAGNWIQQKGIWKYEDAGKYVTNEWRWIDGNNDGIAECYYFDKKGNLLVNTKTPDGYSVDKNGAWTSNGKVVTKSVKAEESSDFRNALLGEWQNFSGRWWFRKNDGSYPVSSWQWIDGNKDGMAECYYFDKEGWLLTSTKTPDGYMVNENGEWISNGVVQRKSTINKANQVAKAKGGGGGAGGSGSSGRVSGGGGSGGRYTGGSSSSSSEEDDEFNPNGKYSIYTYRDKSDDSVSHSANDENFGNWSITADSQKEEVNKVIEEWIQKNKVMNLKDHEKVIEIVCWLSDIVEYERNTKIYTHTAYGALINGKAQCAGYADAFLQIAKKVDLEARYVTGGNHAWNIVKLDGQWHNIDATWTDSVDWRYEKRPKSRKKLRKIFLESNNWEYMFFTDDDVRASENSWFKEHHTRHYPIPAANSKLYSEKDIEIYLIFGNEEERIRHRENVEKYLNEQDKIIEYTTEEETLEKLMMEIDHVMRNPYVKHTVAVRYGDFERFFEKTINLTREIEARYEKKYGTPNWAYGGGLPRWTEWDRKWKGHENFLAKALYGRTDMSTHVVYDFMLEELESKKRKEGIIKIQYVNNNKNLGLQVEPVITRQVVVLKVPEGYKITPPIKGTLMKDWIKFDKKGRIDRSHGRNFLILKDSTLQINELDEDNNFRIGVSPIDE